MVQEALTNALKHADGPVRLERRADAGPLRIRCANRVRLGARTDGSGLGLQGMAERVGLLGGTLRSERTPTAGSCSTWPSRCPGAAT